MQCLQASDFWSDIIKDVPHSYLYFWDALRYCGIGMDFVLGGFHETTQAYNG